MTGQVASSLASSVYVYFAHPLILGKRHQREHQPAAESTEITDDQTYLNLVAAELNNRPRRILGYRTPAEVFADLLTSSMLPPADTAAGWS